MLTIEVMIEMAPKKIYICETLQSEVKMKKTNSK